MNPPSIVALAPNGAYKQKIDHPALPLSLEEIVNTAEAAQHQGASLLHLHIRDAQQQHSLDADIYLRHIDAIEDRLGDGLIIQITSEAAGRFSREQQIACIKTVNPDCVSIALREIITAQADHAAAQDLFEWCAERECRIQFILYSQGDLLRYFNYLQQAVIPAAPHSVLFVLGRYALNAQSSSDDLLPFVEYNNVLNVPWMVCAFGASEQACLLDAAERGGNMRIGFENNLLRPDGQLAKDNSQQLQDLTRALEATHRELANITQAREILAIR